MSTRILDRAWGLLSGSDKLFLLRLLQNSGCGLVVRPEQDSGAVELATDNDGTELKFFADSGAELEVEGDPPLHAAKILDMTDANARARFESITEHIIPVCKQCLREHPAHHACTPAADQTDEATK